MLKGSREKWALSCSFPVPGRFMDQQMEQGIISCRDCPSQACLARTLLLTIGQVLRLLKQVLGKWHRLGPSGLLKLFVLGETPKIEIRMKAKFLGFYLIQNGLPDTLCHFAQSGFAAGLVQEHYPEENRGVACPIAAEAVSNAHNVRCESLHGPLNARVDLALVHESFWNDGHVTIISSPDGSGITPVASGED